MSTITFHCVVFQSGADESRLEVEREGRICGRAHGGTQGSAAGQEDKGNRKEEMGQRSWNGQ